MLEYRELNTEKNELRLITVLGMTAPDPEPDPLNHPLPQEGLLECRLDYVSLNDYAAEYLAFLDIEGSGHSEKSLSYFWDHVQHGVPKVSEHMKSYLAGFVDHPLYHDSRVYNANTSRWTWGDFDALSYVWGVGEREVIVNKQKVTVTKNLYEALRAYGKRNADQKHSLLWVDAICINQRDIVERNIQVKRMKFIYLEARLVWAWVGDGVEGSKAVYDLIDEVGALSRESFDNFPPSVLQSVPERYDNTIWKALAELICRPYWARLWIIQEILSGNTEVRVCFGDHEFQLPSWFCTFAFLRRDLVLLFSQKVEELLSDEEHTLFTESFTTMERLCSLSQFMFKNVARPDLLMLLDTGRHAKQTENKDKIYALLGLIDPEIQGLIDPNYSASILEVFRGFSRAVIKTTRHLEIICQGPSTKFSADDHPSWVADWSTTTPDYQASLFGANKCFCAAAGTEHRYETGDNENHLTCKGIKIDVIDGLGCDISIYDDHTTCNVFMPANGSPRTNVYEHDIGVRMAIWETLTLGDLTKYPPAVSPMLMAVPWFDRNGPTDLEFYGVINRIQQSNGNLEISGKNIAHYFPAWSKDYEFLAISPAMDHAAAALTIACNYRRLTTTRKGYIGLVPKRSRPNDFIFVLIGCSVPLVLRPSGDGLYELIGECYIHGIMNGEAIKDLEESKYDVELVTFC